MKIKVVLTLSLILFPMLTYADPNEDLLNYSEQGSVAAIRKALKDGAKINDARDHRGFSALMLASGSGHLKAVELLLASGADVNLKSNDGWTALIVASETGTPAVVSLLISKGADVNAVGNNNQSALIRATVGNKAENIKVLISKGAKLDHRDSFGAAIHQAANSGYIESLKALIAGKADVNLPTSSDNFTALMYAAQEDHLEAVKILLAAKADVRFQNSKKNTALEFAAEKGNLQIVQQLLSRGANPNNQNSDDGKTPVYIAACKGHLEVVQFLLSKQADPNIKSKNMDWTALRCAKENNERIDDEKHQKLMNILKKAGGREE